MKIFFEAENISYRTITYWIEYRRARVNALVFFLKHEKLCLNEKCY